MRRALCDSIPTKAGQTIELNEIETRHLVSVLRLRTDDPILLLDGKGFQANAKLLVKEKRAYAEVTSPPTSNAKLNALPIHLQMAIIKGDAMEWVIEKAVELGVKSITPIETEFTVVKVQKKGAEAFLERWQKIADQALKQCGRLERMIIHSPLTFEESLLNQKSLIWLDESLAETGEPDLHLAQVLKKNTANEITLLVGPEGGFSASEKNRLLQLTSGARQAITRVHLGSIILRAETAALLGVSLLVSHTYGKTN